MPTALIHDVDFSPDAHGDIVRSVFEETAPADWSVIEYLDEGGFYQEVGPAIDAAIAADADLYIRSASSPWMYRSTFRQAWAAEILPVNAHGSNTDALVLPNPPRLFEAVIVGAEDPSDSDTETSQGPGLELDAEPDPALGLSVAQSWATPAAAAGLARAWEVAPDRAADLGATLPLTPQQRWLVARGLLRQMCTGYDGTWTPERGYGLFEQGAALPEQLRLQPPVDFVAAETAPGVLDLAWVPFDMGVASETRITVPGGEPVYRGPDASVRAYHTTEGAVTLRAQTVADPRASEVGDSPRTLSPATFVPPRPEAKRDGETVSVNVAVVEGATTYQLQRQRPQELFQDVPDWETVGAPQAEPEWTDTPPDRLKTYEYRVLTDAPATAGTYTTPADEAAGETPWEAGLIPEAAAA